MQTAHRGLRLPSRRRSPDDSGLPQVAEPCLPHRPAPLQSGALRHHLLRVLKPLIEPRDYTSTDAFRAEVDRIFMRRWIFACSLDGLANDLDYRCVEFGGVSVIVQNFEGEIRAFNNVCSHRF